MEAGRIAARQDLAQNIAMAATPEEVDAWATPAGGGDWADKAVEQAATLASKDAGRTLWRQAAAKAAAGEITAEQKDHIHGLIGAQMEHLDSPERPVEGTVSAPDGDSWQGDISAMTTKEDATALLDKVDKDHRGGVLDSRRAKALRVAIRTAAENLPSAPGEAA